MGLIAEEELRKARVRLYAEGANFGTAYPPEGPDGMCSVALFRADLLALLASPPAPAGEEPNHGRGKEGSRQSAPPLTQQGAATPGSPERDGKAPAGDVAEPQTVSDTGSHTAPSSVTPPAPAVGLDRQSNEDWYAEVNQGRRGPPHPTDEQITAMRARLVQAAPSDGGGAPPSRINEMADLAQAIGQSFAADAEFPNYGECPVHLPAGHWRAILALLSPNGASQQDAATLNAPREAFLDLIADASEWHEEGDEEGFSYTLRFGHQSLLPLLSALGIEPQKRIEYVDGQPFGMMETPADALERIIDAACAAQSRETEG